MIQRGSKRHGRCLSGPSDTSGTQGTSGDTQAHESSHKQLSQNARSLDLEVLEITVIIWLTVLKFECLSGLLRMIDEDSSLVTKTNSLVKRALTILYLIKSLVVTKPHLWRNTACSWRTLVSCGNIWLVNSCATICSQYTGCARCSFCWCRRSFYHYFTKERKQEKPSFFIN